MDYPKIVILIPARFAAMRFPGKPLALIAGRPMIQHVYQNLSRSSKNMPYAVDVYVVTDDERIETAVKQIGGQVLRVNDDVASGSERVFLAYQRFLKTKSPALVVNVQGDEPLLFLQDLLPLFDFHLKSTFDITTLIRPRKDDPEGFMNPNRVKAVVTQGGKCLYFSRSPIPYGDSKGEWNLHVGVYSYTTSALERFFTLTPSPFERREKLEQLRALEGNLNIGALSIHKELLGVDSPEDIPIIEGVLRGQNN
ncbi:MAG: 3-deoxy-manno-octulosonate cytidylyltransferase [Bdellovibrio sp.]|nr:3-deoxy-manno-octulosonate cytidylyltransferase [Bdellovibrio sp.]